MRISDRPGGNLGLTGPLFGAPFAFQSGERSSQKFSWTVVGIVGGALILSIVALRSAPAYMQHNRQILQVKQSTSQSNAILVEDVNTNSDNVASKALQPPLDFYLKTLRGTLFSPPTPPAPPTQPLPAPQPVAPMPINPFADWAYTGTVHVGDETIALIENSKTGEGKYVRTGDSFLGAQVQSVSDEVVMLKLGVKPIVLSRSNSIVITPLDKSAEVVQPQQGTNQNNQQVPAGQNMPMMNGAQMQNTSQFPNLDRAAMRAFWRQMRRGMASGGFQGGQPFVGGNRGR